MYLFDFAHRPGLRTRVAWGLTLVRALSQVAVTCRVSNRVIRYYHRRSFVGLWLLQHRRGVRVPAARQRHRTGRGGVGITRAVILPRLLGQQPGIFW